MIKSVCGCECTKIWFDNIYANIQAESKCLAAGLSKRFDTKLYILYVYRCLSRMLAQTVEIESSTVQAMQLATHIASVWLQAQTLLFHKSSVRKARTSVHTGHIQMPTCVPRQNMGDTCPHWAVSSLQRKGAYARSIVSTHCIARVKSNLLWELLEPRCHTCLGASLVPK